ncbi:MAG: hypothetical protein RIG26_13300 [Thalassospira sp.]
MTELVQKLGRRKGLRALYKIGRSLMETTARFESDPMGKILDKDQPLVA